MAFKRQKRHLIKFEFEYTGDQGETKYLNYEVEHDTDLAQKLTDMGKLDFKTMSSTEAKQALRRAYDTILGIGAMDDIQEKVFGGDDLLLTDYLGIGNYLIGEVDKANKELVELTKTFIVNRNKDAVDGIIVDEK